MEKAFDRNVWKAGLRLKYLQSGVKGIHVSMDLILPDKRKLMFMQMALTAGGRHGEKEYRRVECYKSHPLHHFNQWHPGSSSKQGVKCCVCRLCCSFEWEKYVGKVNYRLQQTLKSIEGWIAKWQLDLNESKTVFALFSLCNSKQKVHLWISTTYWGQP